MRIRIALTTALAVLVVPAVLFALFSSSPAASARARHVAGVRHQEATADTKLMSYSQAQKVAKLATFYNAVTLHQEQTFFAEINYFQAVAKQRAAQQAAAAAAAAAAATARARAAATVVVSAPAPSVDSGSDATSTNTPHWACIRQHESGGNYADYNGGAYQFEFGTWHGLTGLPAPAQDYPPSVQDAAALKLYAERGWEPWTTRHVCGL